MFARWRARLSPAARGGLFYFGYYGAAATYMPFLSVFFARRGLSGQEIGVLAAVGPLMALLAAPALSALADRRGWRLQMLSAAMAGSALSLLALLVPDSFWGLLVVVALLAIAASPIAPIADGLMARMAARRGLSYGQMRLWGSLSYALVAAAGGALWQEAGFRVVLPVAAALFLALMLVAPLLDDERPVTTEAPSSLRVVTRDSRLRIVLVATFLLGLGMGMALTFGGIYMDRLSGGQFLVGLFAGLTAFCELPTMHWSENLIRRLSAPWTLVLAYVLQGSGYIGFLYIRQPELLLGVAVLQGLGFGLFLPTTVRLVDTLAPAEWATTFQGLLSAGVWGLAPLVAGLLGGSLFDAGGAPAVFVACVVVTVAAALLLVGAQLAGIFRRAGEPPRDSHDPPAAPGARETGPSPA